MIKILIRNLDTKIPLPKYETDGSSGMDLSAYLKNDLVIAPNEKDDTYRINGCSAKRL